MAPAPDGAVAVMVNDAVAPVANPADRVSEQLKVAPAAEGKLPQDTLETPCPGVTAVATVPAGSTSATVADRPEVAVPLLPTVSV